MTRAFLDGDDICAGCGRCCHDIEALRVTDADLERLPLLAPHVTSRDGVFSLIDVAGPCPYLLPDGRCGTFATRPYDCSLYPINLHGIGVREGDGSVAVRWNFTAQDCPERPTIVHAARRTGVDQVAEWATEVLGAPVRLVFEGSRPRETVAWLLHRVGVLRWLQARRGKPMPVKPDRERA